ncbi:TPA: DUF551 domain-containing protein [Klebsiella pneumoniae]|uniref:DUF551 domain-containing protein n=1 Tax=Klebsiella TaxID=570 RepID=UPI000807B97E|nr:MULTISPECIES: DUF551 domain-containing protein [Klebsiella]MCQ8846365.1 DUF551 domain-containing protein [Klebsiella sp. KJ_S1]HBW2241181.1 DUF551 domain-containing protein [Klebsiella quasipneumoniae subsp. similipneumoniae]EKV5510820.1 DUF551 domain-containing protein [Klebsiella pneumoniae]EKW8247359.1 DUF551 domain-containing protein [Klebsiella pneumoniae]EKW9225084.1 DUF551 domain-containing protein [Klebsiella pneumoniae]
MTKSTITREESVQAVFDLKVGYRLGFADLEILKRVARMALAAMGSSESVELPLDYLQGHKDGLEWAAQLAESNHPQTGDWLYDDPIELAKAIRKGPDMPPAQPAPVVPPECVAPVSTPSNLAYEAGWNACRAAMLAAAQHDTPALNPVQSVVTVPGKWIPVSERMPEVGVKVLCFPAEDEPIHAVFNGQLWLQDVSWSGSEEPIDNVIPVTVTHWMPLPAGPQEVR